MTTPERPLAWLDGQLLPLDEARVPALDRGFLFGDGVYEVLPVYGGHPCRMDEHLERLAASLEATGIPNPYDRPGWRRLLTQLAEANGGGDLALYLQVTRGVAPKRDHAVAPGLVPTVFAMAMPLPPRPTEVAEHGITAVTLPDTRWALCQIKAITLLANVMQKQAAATQGADEALLVRDGRVVEATASNVFAVIDDVLVTLGDSQRDLGHQFHPRGEPGDHPRRPAGRRRSTGTAVAEDQPPLPGVQGWPGSRLSPPTMSPDERSLFDFPCSFPIKAMGRNEGDFETTVVDIVRRHAPDLGEGAVRAQSSGGERFVSITVTITATSRDQIDAIYADLTAADLVLMAL